MATMRLFPTKVTLPDGTVHNPARAESRDGHLRVWAIVDRAPALVALVPDDQVHQAANNPDAPKLPQLLGYTDSGILIQRGSGCGCSHPLKRFRPPASLANYPVPA